MLLQERCSPNSEPSSQQQPHHQPTYHVVQGVQCVAVSVPMPALANHNDNKNNDSPPIVTILEATATAQDELVNHALLTEQELLLQQQEQQDETDATSTDSSSSGSASPLLLLSAGDPYGAVLWPAAAVVAHTLIQQLEAPAKPPKTKWVLELGAGTGLVSLTALLWNHKQQQQPQAPSFSSYVNRVVATDYEPLPLALLEHAAHHLNHPPTILWNDTGNNSKEDTNTNSTSSLSSWQDRLECRLLDLCNFTQPLPFPHITTTTPTPTDDDDEANDEQGFVVAADILYEPRTGRAMAHRIVQALSYAYHPPKDDTNDPTNTTTTTTTTELQLYPHNHHISTSSSSTTTSTTPTRIKPRRSVTVIVGDSPGRPGRPIFLQTLQSLLHNDRLDFAPVQGSKVHGPRHELICGPGSESAATATATTTTPSNDSNNDTPLSSAVTVAVLVLSSDDYYATL